MAWTAPRTWTTAEVVTAAMMNTHVRDNFLETSAATVTTAGDLAYADAANSMGSRLAIGATGTTLISTGSAPVYRVTDGMTGDGTYTVITPPTSFSNFNVAAWGSGTEVSVTVTTGATALVHFGARYVSHATVGENIQLSYQITGATTVTASNLWGTVEEISVSNDQQATARSHWRTGLTPGSNKFILNGMASASNTCTVALPFIIVEAH